MEQKTNVSAEEGQHKIIITREFGIPVALLFKAYTEAEFIAQWMENEVVKQESKKHGGYHYRKADEQGNVVFEAHGAIHEFVPEEQITRTFEMVNSPFGVQLELLAFHAVDESKSFLTIHTIFESVEKRDQLLKLPFSYGLNMGHNRLEAIIKDQFINNN